MTVHLTWPFENLYICALVVCGWFFFFFLLAEQLDEPTERVLQPDKPLIDAEEPSYWVKIMPIDKEATPMEYSCCWL